MTERHLPPAACVTSKEVIDPLKDVLDTKGLGVGVEEILSKAAGGQQLSPVEQMIAYAAGYVEDSKVIKSSDL